MSFASFVIERLRAETPGASESIYLNNCGSALMPRPVLDTVVSYLELESRIGGYEAKDARAGEIDAAYQAVADLLGCAKHNVAFVENATVAFSQALSSIPFAAGDRIVTSREDYVSNQLMFLALARRFGVTVERVPSRTEGGIDLEAMIEAIRRRRPKLVALTHVPTNSGLVQPIEAVGRICREADVLYLVDACQSVGQLPIDVRAIGCDFLCATSRKFLRGPRGVGFLYASDRVFDAGLEPLFIDTRGAEWRAPDAYVAAPGAVRFENWEFSYALLLGLGEAARYAGALGLDAIAERTTGLAALARRSLADAGLRTLDRGERPCGIVSVEIPNWEPLAFQDALGHRGVRTSASTRVSSVLDFADKGVDWALRVSPHYYNTEDEIRSAVAAISGVARSSM